MRNVGDFFVAIGIEASRHIRVLEEDLTYEEVEKILVDDLSSCQTPSNDSNLNANLNKLRNYDGDIIKLHQRTFDNNSLASIDNMIDDLNAKKNSLSKADESRYTTSVLWFLT